AQVEPANKPTPAAGQEAPKKHLSTSRVLLGIIGQTGWKTQRTAGRTSTCQCDAVRGMHMPTNSQTLRVAILAWEIGRVNSGLGTKIGGLGAIIEELPAALVKAARQQDIALDITILSPCFAHYDRRQLTRLVLSPQVTLSGHTFPFEVYEHVFDDGQKAVYFWDQGQLHWTNASAIYPSDPWMALRLYAAVGQAMACYIAQGHFDIVHLHDYHVGLVPFYLDDDYLHNVSVHCTIHNATYQGITPLRGGGYSTLDDIDLPGERLFHKYFDFFDRLNLMKACMLKV